MRRAPIETPHQHDANMIDMDLDRLARRAYDHGIYHETWMELSRRIDAARTIARKLMHPRRREMTEEPK